MMQTEANIDLTDKELLAIEGVLQERLPGRPAYVFGSRVTGLARPDSDLDLAVGGEMPLTFHDRGALNEAFEAIGLQFKVDVLDLHDARGVFRKRIEAEWVPWEQAKLSRVKAVA